MGFSFESDWLRKWCKFSGPIIKRKKANLQQSQIISDTILKIFIKWSEEIDKILRQEKFISFTCRVHSFSVSATLRYVFPIIAINMFTINKAPRIINRKNMICRKKGTGKQPVYEFRTIATENISRECHKTITNRYRPIRTMVITTRSQGTHNKFMWQRSRKGQVNKLAANGLSFASQVWREFFKSSPMQQN